MDGISHKEIVEGITAVAVRVFGVLLPADTVVELGDRLHTVMQHDVIEVLRHQGQDTAYVSRANWSKPMQDAGERMQLALHALVMGIYE